MVKKTLLLLLLFFTAACSLYESEGRKAIAEGTISLQKVSSLPQSISQACFISHSEPSYLKQPMEVLSSHHHKKLTAYVSPEEAPLVTVYVYKKQNNSHKSCRYTFPAEYPAKTKTNAILSDAQLTLTQ